MRPVWIIKGFVFLLEFSVYNGFMALQKNNKHKGVDLRWAIFNVFRWYLNRTGKNLYKYMILSMYFFVKVVCNR